MRRGYNSSALWHKEESLSTAGCAKYHYHHHHHIRLNPPKPTSRCWSRTFYRPECPSGRPTNGIKGQNWCMQLLIFTQVTCCTTYSRGSWLYTFWDPHDATIAEYRDKKWELQNSSNYATSTWRARNLILLIHTMSLKRERQVGELYFTRTFLTHAVHWCL